MLPVYIVFGTESGNAQGLAERTGEALRKEGLSCSVIDMLDLKHDAIAEMRLLLVITSTYGNGDPPSNAEAFHAYLMKKAPPLPHVAFSVCGLGDTTYDRFAQCGKDFDQRLGELGAERIHPRKDCDVDYEGPFEAWLSGVTPALLARARADTGTSAAASAIVATEAHVDAPGTRRNPIRAKVLANEPINPGSSKETRHLALGFDASALRYEVGDSIGIWPVNDPALVEEILRTTGLDGTTIASVGETSAPLAELLATKLEIQEPDVRLVDRALGTTTAEARQAATRSHHVVDLVAIDREKHTVPWTADALVHHLRPLAPRLYSIASSPRVHPGEVWLLVDVLRYELRTRARAGVTSGLVAERSPVGAELSVFLHPSPSFRLAPRDRDIVMIGPGTGVAPFRAFLEEREATPGSGRSWLFFGARNRAHDAFYAADFDRFSQSGALTKLDCAYSRDQAHKVYVQDRLRERADELASWVRGGATIYVCGDATRMAPDVHAALRDILSARGLSLEAVEAEGRYLRDVY